VNFVAGVYGPRSVKKQFLINCEKRRAEEEGKEESEVKR